MYEEQLEAKSCVVFNDTCYQFHEIVKAKARAFQLFGEGENECAKSVIVVRCRSETNLPLTPVYCDVMREGMVKTYLIIGK